MKATTVRKPAAYYSCRSAAPCRYPNAARKGYFLDKVIDAVLAAAITLAVLTALLFLFTAL